ncbi:MAG: hypothetical protein Q8O29_16780 [Polaromonas sp.]|nr:hypothetical protein [Polaromonas sp.]MDP2819890.1 hypothetical protein [Polaromonas sp.]
MPTRLKDFATSVVATVEPETTALVAAQLISAVLGARDREFEQRS